MCPHVTKPYRDYLYSVPCLFREMGVHFDHRSFMNPWSISGEVLKACALWCMEAWVWSTDHLVMVGIMCMCDHVVESTQEGYIHKCCSDMRWPGLFDEVRRAFWWFYLSICKYWLLLRRMDHFWNLCKVRSLSINSPFFASGTKFYNIDLVWHSVIVW